MAEAIEHAPEFADKDLWFGVNPVGLPIGQQAGVDAALT